MRKTICVLAVLLTIIFISIAKAEPYQSIIVKHKDCDFQSHEEFTAYLSKKLEYELKFKKKLGSGAFVYNIIGHDFKAMSPELEELFNNDINVKLSELEFDKDILYAEPDKKFYALATPSDDMYKDQWQYFDPQGGINLEKAWDITTGSSNITIGIVDTGIVRHAEYLNKVVHGRNFIDGEDKDNFYDTGIYIPQLGYNIYHGSHVAGTSAASANNGGVVGVSWGAKILPVKVLGSDGSGTLSGIIEGVLWAANASEEHNPNPAHVLNLSLGGWGYCSGAMQDAINKANEKGVTIVVAAGNDNFPADFFTPASCDNVITVAANNRYGAKASYSNYGRKIDIVAPGGETAYQYDKDGILSTHERGGYYYMQGTSMASPHVAGAVALILSVNPDLKPNEIEDIIKKSAAGNLLGVGQLDVYEALKLTAKGVPTPKAIDRVT